MNSTILLRHRFILLSSLLGSHSLWASGIYLDVQNGAGTGHAFAGAAASAEDASTVFFNPAGMPQLGQGQHAALALSGVSIDSRYEDTGSSPLSTQVPLGNTHAEIHRAALVPAIYYATSLTAMVQLGMGISPLFANEGSWPGFFAGRYQGSDTTIHAINYNPSLAVEVSDVFSVGFGIDYLDIDAELGRKIPIIANGEYVGDGELTVKGHDAAWGYNLGALWQIMPETRIGLSYRSSTSLEIEGQAIRSTSESQRVVLPGEAKIKVPEMASLALAYQWGHWEFLEDITWSGWSTVPGIYVQHQDSGFELFSEQLNFRDGWRVGSGANYRYADDIKLRVGVAYDRSVVPDPASRTVRFPDNHRKWLGFGVRYALSESSSVDAGYAHIFVSDTKISRQTEYATPTSQVLRGDISSSGNVLSVQLNQQW